MRGIYPSPYLIRPIVAARKAVLENKSLLVHDHLFDGHVVRLAQKFAAAWYPRYPVTSRRAV
jgi:hypothetical protein